MKVYKHTGITEVIGIGDTHGSNNWIAYNSKRIGLENAIIFQVGDFGVGFFKKEHDLEWMSKLNEDLSKLNCTMYVIRGNHDNPEYFKGDYSFSNLILLEDYSIVSINEKNGFLCIGGAISVDRKNRVEGENWWPDENFKYNPSVLEEIESSGVLITDVITHTCPSIHPLPGFSGIVYDFARNDDSLIVDLTAEREKLNELYFKLSERYHVSRWTYGHFHFSNVETIDSTRFTCLGIKEMKSIITYESDQDFMNRILR